MFKKIKNMVLRSWIIIFACSAAGLVFALVLGWVSGVADAQPPNQIMDLFVAAPSIFLQKKMTFLGWMGVVFGMFSGFLLRARNAAFTEQSVLPACFGFGCVFFILSFASESSIPEWGVVRTWNLLPIDFIFHAQSPWALSAIAIVAMIFHGVDNLFPKFKTALDAFGYALAAVAAIYYCVRLGMVEMPPIIGQSVSENHTVPLTFPVFLAGHGGFVYKDAWSQYGGFAQWVAALPDWGDSADKLRWSMTAALFAEISCLFYAIKKASDSVFVGLVGMLACLWIAGATERTFLIYQALHLRWLFPCLILALSASFNEKKTWRAIVAVLPWAIHWNPETGLACSAACAFAVASLSMAFWHNGETAKSLLLWIASLGVAFLTSIGLLIFIYGWATGSAPDLQKAYESMRIFGAAGFMSLKSSPLHWWWLLILAAAAGLNASIQACSSPQKNVLVLAAWLQLFLLPYFLGRSAYTNLIGLAYPSVLIALSLCSIALSRANNLQLRGLAGTKALRSMAFVGILFFVLCASAMLTSEINGPLARTPEHDKAAMDNKIAVAGFVRSTAWTPDLSKTAFVAPQAAAMVEMLGLNWRSLPSAPLSGVILRSQANEWQSYVKGADEVYFDPSFVLGGEADAYDWRGQLMLLLQNEFYAVERIDVPDGMHPFFHMVSKAKKEKMEQALAAKKASQGKVQE